MKYRRYASRLALMLSMTILSGCGKQPMQESSEMLASVGESVPGLSDVVEETDSLVSVSETVEMDGNFTSITTGKPILAGAQFYHGEPVKIWCKPNSGAADEALLNVYCFDEEGQGVLIVKHAPIAYSGTWYLAEEGFCLTFTGNQITRIEADGQVSYTTNVESEIRDVCQLADGRFILSVMTVEGNYRLAELNAQSGEYALAEGIDLGKDNRQFVAAAENGLQLLNQEGFWDVNLETGELTCVIPMQEYEFTLTDFVKDFRLIKGCAELLYLTDTDVLWPTDIEKYKTALTLNHLRTYNSHWLSVLVENFNRSNYEYYVKLDTLETYYVDLDEEEVRVFLQQIQSDISEGKGPDILTVDTVSDPLRFMEQGQLVNLSPYMERDGIYEEDFFYSAFGSWRKNDAIFGANIFMGCAGLKVSRDLLLDGEVPDIEDFVAELLDYGGGAVFVSGWSGQDILEYFFTATEDFFGMADIGKGTCNFETLLLENMIEAAKLYADNGAGELPALGEITNTGWYRFDSEEKLEQSEQVYVGYFFDEGNYTAMDGTFMLGINENSPNKEGAWEFIKYALSQEHQKQNKNGIYLREFPVNRNGFTEVVQLELEEGAYVMIPRENGGTVFAKAGWEKRSEAEYEAIHNLTEPMVEEINTMLENARAIPTYTRPIIDIILQESQHYFDNEKNLDEVCTTIQQKAQEFLTEYRAK